MVPEPGEPRPWTTNPETPAGQQVDEVPAYDAKAAHLAAVLATTEPLKRQGGQFAVVGHALAAFAHALFAGPPEHPDDAAAPVGDSETTDRFGAPLATPEGESGPAGPDPAADAELRARAELGA